MRVQKQEFASSQLSCNSCSRLTGARELRKLICKLSLLNSHKLFVVYANSRVDTSWAKKRQYGNSYAHKHRQTGASFIMTNYLRSSFNYCELAWVVYLDK